MRGERHLVSLLIVADDGSSPHARGTQPHRDHDVPQVRFIPACAGNARRPRGRTCASSVHPRMRGERNKGLIVLENCIGSSPHARGTLAKSTRIFGSERFIPACAGNAIVWPVPPSVESVHPRMRGERTKHVLLGDQGSGSSPHARGTPDHRQHSAGIHPVHPRMRGERDGRMQGVSPSIGSSPHARGTLDRRYQAELRRRFIPACAGNAAPALAHAGHHSVHPRMRGERTSNKLLIYRRKSEPSDSTKHSGC